VLTDGVHHGLESDGHFVLSEDDGWLLEKNAEALKEKNKAWS